MLTKPFVPYYLVTFSTASQFHFLCPLIKRLFSLVSCWCLKCEGKAPGEGEGLSIRGLLHDCEIFANLRLKLYCPPSSASCGIEAALAARQEVSETGNLGLECRLDTELGNHSACLLRPGVAAAAAADRRALDPESGVTESCSRGLRRYLVYLF